MTELAYNYVRDGILHGRIPFGTVLAEHDVAQAIGSSRTPVRHALAKLHQEGLLELGPRRQLIVRGFAPEHLDEVRLLREALESVSVARACETMTDDEIDELRLNLLRQRRTATEEREDDFIDLDEEFHLAIAQAARLPLLEGFLRQLREFVRLARIGARRPSEVLLQVVAEHERLLDAIEARDVVAAHAALVDHLDSSPFDEVARDEEEIRGPLGKAAHEIGVPLGAEGRSDEHRVAAADEVKL
jgi:DNA-binding GntR family transcriptional regulator